MGYRDIYKESNEQAEERFSLVMERIAEIAEETDVPEKFDDYFKKTAAFLLQLKNVSEKAEKDTLKDASLTECEKQNAGFYDELWRTKNTLFPAILIRLNAEWKSDLCSRKTGRRVRTDFICTVCRVS